jgi:hypothetical protein
MTLDEGIIGRTGCRGKRGNEAVLRSGAGPQ